MREKKTYLCALPGMPIRFLLAYLEVEYDDQRYILTKPPHSRDVWLADKPNLGLDFPNVSKQNRFKAFPKRFSSNVNRIASILG